MDEIYHDSMAITRYNHHPDIFLTMIANPNWEEIRGSLFQHQHPHERPDIVARMFELKRKALMDEIQQNKVIGTTVTHVYTIEFQKRGLPHMHALIFLDKADKIHTPEKVDNIVCAEFPDEVDDPLLFKTIQKCMVHGPCGSRKPDALCMNEGKCAKKYPKQYSTSTSLPDEGYPIYRRRNDGRVFRY
ncbi:uncharacterized protein LOC113333243 [Papaver somniferum]|uniref:uncharacterized protein LOC113333243 n=1 Tax=Papaver somniferum TaxID=3469 RepID=UPI000E6FE505|nr:uncharacterized protein LOC113333243 [Papaver somniferum]